MNFLQSNLLALSNKNSQLAMKLKKLSFQSTVKRVICRNGDASISMSHDGKNSFHSQFNPTKEGERFADSCKINGYYIVLGFGAGFHLRSMLVNEHVHNLLLIDYDIQSFYDTIYLLDLKELLSNSKLSILISPTPDQLIDFLLKQYFPALYGQLNTLHLRSRVEMNYQFFDDCITAIHSAVNLISDDFTVQNRFGNIWFRNTLLNLPAAEQTSFNLGRVQDVMITGAGPSLDSQIPDIKRHRDTRFLIATDTSASALLENDISPDLIVTIDCQIVTYHHFLQKIPSTIPVVADLASTPSVIRTIKKPVFFISGHPFSLYTQKYWRNFPLLDITGGNVSHAAISLAEQLGANTIYLYGVDFSYPEGKSYAKGTYLYKYFDSFANRYKSTELSFFEFILRNKNIIIEEADDYIRYVTRPMINYKERLETFSKKINSQIIPLYDKGVQLKLDTKSSFFKQSNIISSFSSSYAEKTSTQFIQEYLKNIERLPKHNHDIMKQLGKLPTELFNTFLTVLPTAAQIRVQHESKSPEEILDAAISKMRETVKQALIHS